MKNIKYFLLVIFLNKILPKVEVDSYSFSDCLIKKNSFLFSKKKGIVGNDEKIEYCLKDFLSKSSFKEEEEEELRNFLTKPINEILQFNQFKSHGAPTCNYRFLLNDTDYENFINILPNENQEGDKEKILTLYVQLSDKINKNNKKADEIYSNHKYNIFHFFRYKLPKIIKNIARENKTIYFFKNSDLD